MQPVRQYSNLRHSCQDVGKHLLLSPSGPHLDIYLINLERRPDRLSEISSQLAGLDLEYVRVAAIDGATIGESQYSILDKATEACWQSHQKVFALIAQGPASNALVLEDDAVLNPEQNWRGLLNDLDAYMTRSSIDILQLGFAERVFVTKMQKLICKAALAIRHALKLLYMVFYKTDDSILDDRWDCLGQTPNNLKLVPNEFRGGSHCYMISRRAARLFLNLNTPTFLGTDDFLTTMANYSPDFRSFKFARSSKSLADQRYHSGVNACDSDIEPHTAIFRAASQPQKP